MNIVPKKTIQRSFAIVHKNRSEALTKFLRFRKKVQETLLEEHFINFWNKIKSLKSIVKVSFTCFRKPQIFSASHHSKSPTEKKNCFKKSSEVLLDMLLNFPNLWKCNCLLSCRLLLEAPSICSKYLWKKVFFSNLSQKL